MPEHKTSDCINLRPRITVHRELHPELYERLNSVDPDLHNALIVQMLIKYAALEKYAGIGFRSDVLVSNSDAKNLNSSDVHAFKQKKAPQKTISKDVKPLNVESPPVSEKLPAGPTVHEMKEAIGSFSWD